MYLRLCKLLKLAIFGNGDSNQAAVLISISRIYGDSAKATSRNGKTLYQIQHDVEEDLEAGPHLFVSGIRPDD